MSTWRSGTAGSGRVACHMPPRRIRTTRPPPRNGRSMPEAKQGHGVVKLLVNATASFTQSDEHALQQCLEGAAPDVFGRDTISAVQRTKYHSCTSYDAYDVRVRLRSGA